MLEIMNYQKPEEALVRNGNSRKEMNITEKCGTLA